MNFTVENAFCADIASSIQVSPSDSSVVSSLSLSDIIDIPDDDADSNPGTAPATLPTSRTNAMSLGFILSGHLWNGPFSNGLPHSATSVSPSSSTTEDVLEIQHQDKHDGMKPIIRGWAPPDPGHCTLLDALELPKLPSSGTTSVLPVALPIALTGLPRVCESWSRNDLGGSTTASLGQAPVGLGAPTSGNHQHNLIPASRPLPANSQHLAAGLTGVHRYHGLALAAHTRGPIPVPVSAPFPLLHAALPSKPAVPSTQPQTINSKSPFTIPPPPRGGVAPTLARSITHIRLARERAVQAYVTRPHPVEGGSATGTGSGPDATERMPSVLGKSVRETPRRMGCEGMCTCGGCRY